MRKQYKQRQFLSIPQALPYLDWPSGNVSSTLHFFDRCAPCIPKNKIWDVALSNNVALPWIQRHKNWEQTMLINVGKTQI